MRSALLAIILAISTTIATTSIAAAASDPHWQNDPPIHFPTPIEDAAYLVGCGLQALWYDAPRRAGWYFRNAWDCLWHWDVMGFSV